MPDVYIAESRAYPINALTVGLRDREVISMGDVLITYKIMPSGVEVDFKEMKEEIKRRVGSLGKIAEFDLQPIAFGLKALIVKIIVKDEGGITDKIEEKLNKIENVQGVVVEEVSLI